ncbi:arylsulfatase A-like enzyme [Pedobacter sp. W3I1]|uniref:arylsulfatase n=1 Tax=Pedobacter sp. W3I1 TaxID=3042291 RepID=UPI00277E4FDC|nr:arylsulfatase [Pedobacter sp. W3I1]MDQ0641716.1 arylsulfatase A-like enzyme [Pedobacter sp. W3I1]
MRTFTKYSGLFLIFLLAVLTAFINKPKPKKVIDKRPNIIVILADDLGFSDIGCYGGEIKTPNIDYLASQGVRFKSFYNTSRCCPTRAALLTGLYNHNAGIGEMTTDRGLEGYRGAITKNTVTLAEVLKDAGYRTAMSGKWHVSNTIEQPTPQAQLDWLNHKTSFPLFSPIDQYPTSRGFEKFFGTLWGVVDFFDPFSLVSGTTPIKDVPKNYYHTDAINDTAATYIREFSKGDKPFFLYVAENAPHWPLQAKPEDIAKYKDTYKVGWDAIREARYKRMVAMGLIDPKTAPLSPRQSTVKWEDNPTKAFDEMAMAVHAAMIDRMDQGIGRIIKALKETDQLDNTLIVFLSDNGASPEDAMRYGPGFDRPSETRAGEKIVYPIYKKVMPGPQTSYTSIGPIWANVANTPYQLAKAQSYEGGVHTPMIAFWPKGIAAKKGSYTDQVGHVMDFMATFVELAHAKYPGSYKGNTIKPLQGLSLVPALKGKISNGHEILFNEHFNAGFVRAGDWKMVNLSGDSTQHLYNIKNDQTELNDVAAQHPDKVKELNAKWQAWAKENHVLPKR